MPPPPRRDERLPLFPRRGLFNRGGGPVRRSGPGLTSRERTALGAPTLEGRSPGGLLTQLPPGARAALGNPDTKVRYGPRGELQESRGRGGGGGGKPGGVTLDKLVQLYYKTPAGEKFMPEDRGTLGGLGDVGPGLFTTGAGIGSAVASGVGGLLGIGGDGGGGDDKGKENIREMLGALRGEGLSKKDARSMLRDQLRAEAGVGGVGGMDAQGGVRGLGPNQEGTVGAALGYMPTGRGAAGAAGGAGGMMPPGMTGGSSPEAQQMFFEQTIMPYAESKYGQMLDAANQYEQQMFSLAPSMAPAAQEMIATTVPQIGAQMRQEAGNAFSQFMGSDPATAWYGRILSADRRYGDIANELYGDMAAGGGMGGYMDPFAAADPMAMFASDPFMSGMMGVGGQQMPMQPLGVAQMPQPTAPYNPFMSGLMSGASMGGGRSGAYSAARSTGTTLDNFFGDFEY